MRTAVTTAVTHDGKDVLLAGRTVSLLKQKAEFKEARAERSHPKFKEVTYQESDGHALTIRYLSPEAAKADEARRNAEAEAAKKAGEREVELSKMSRVDRERVLAEEQKARESEAAKRKAEAEAAKAATPAEGSVEKEPGPAPKEKVSSGPTATPSAGESFLAPKPS